MEHNDAVRYGGAVTLVQLATPHHVYLIDALALADHRAAIFNCLHPVFSNPSILKILHGAENDVFWLRRDCGLRLVNVFDTQAAADQLHWPTSLASLQQRLCGGSEDTLLRKAALQTSDWSARPLSPEQVAYAVNDVWYLAYIAAQLVQRLRECDTSSTRLENALRTSQLRTRCLGGRGNRWGGRREDAVALLRRVPDIDDRIARRLYALCQWRDAMARRRDCGVQAVLSDEAVLQLARTGQAGMLSVLKKGDCRAVERMLTNPPPWEGWRAKLPVTHDVDKVADRQRRLARLVDKFSAKGPVYDNCRMLSMDGKLLCFCDRRKLEWCVPLLFFKLYIFPFPHRYIDKNLAQRVSDDPPTIRLRFQHSTNDQENAVDEFYAESKSNCCVVCGEAGHYLRYRVIPQCYRKHLPIALKSHRSHDIVLLCVPCHIAAARSAERTKRAVAEEFGVPMVPPCTAAAAEETAAVVACPDGHVLNAGCCGGRGGCCFTMGTRFPHLDKGWR